jgi:hypothetical protein
MIYKYAVTFSLPDCNSHQGYVVEVETITLQAPMSRLNEWIEETFPLAFDVVVVLVTPTNTKLTTR